jgi:hypothetical protein
MQKMDFDVLDLYLEEDGAISDIELVFEIKV